MLGITFMCVMTDLDDNKHVRVTVANPQNGYGALNTHIGWFGVGQSNNYIEDFTVTRTFLDSNLKLIVSS